MTKAQRMILGAATSDALRAAGEMAASIDMLTRATARTDAEAAGNALTKLLKARYAYDRAMVALTEARNACS